MYRPVSTAATDAPGMSLWLPLIGLLSVAPVVLLGIGAFHPDAGLHAEMSAAFGLSLGAFLAWSLYFRHQDRASMLSNVVLVVGNIASATALGLSIVSLSRYGSLLGVVMPAVVIIAVSYVFGHYPAMLEDKSDGRDTSRKWLFGGLMFVLSVVPAILVSVAPNGASYRTEAIALSWVAVGMWLAYFGGLRRLGKGSGDDWELSPGLVFLWVAIAVDGTKPREPALL